MSARHALKLSAHGKTIWTPELDAELIKLWGEGLSAPVIALKLGAPSRNAVLGRARRIGLEPRKAETKPKLRLVEAVRHPAATRVAPTPAEPAQRPFLPASALPLSARPWETRRLLECAWPIDTETGVWSCCAPVREGKAYCKAHCRRMYARSPQAAAAS